MAIALRLCLRLHRFGRCGQTEQKISRAREVFGSELALFLASIRSMCRLNGVRLICGLCALSPGTSVAKCRALVSGWSAVCRLGFGK